MTAVSGDTATLESDPRTTPAARAALYALLARGFDHPDEKLHTTAANGSLRTEALGYADETGFDISVPELTTERDYQSLAALYNGLFEIGHVEYTDRTDGSEEAEGPPVPLYESRYRDASWDDINTDLARAYEHFGVSVDQNQREHHDNLRLELEFAGYLARREALGSNDAARARRDLLDRHLEPFIEGVLEALTDHDSGLYTDLAELACQVVGSDLAALRETFDDPEGAVADG